MSTASPEACAIVVVASTTCRLSNPKRFAASVAAESVACVCATNFGTPVVPDVISSTAGASMSEVLVMGRSALSKRSSHRCTRPSSTASPITKRASAASTSVSMAATAE